MSAAEITERIERLRAQLQTANGEWADRITDDIQVFEQMLLMLEQK